MLQTISPESISISKIVDETATMKWTIVTENKVTGIFKLSMEKPTLLRISFEIKEGKTLYNNRYASRLTVVRSQSGKRYNHHSQVNKTSIQ